MKKFESTDPGIGLRQAIASAKQDHRIEGIHWDSRAVLWTREWDSDEKRRKRPESPPKNLDSLRTEAAGLLGITEQKPESKTNAKR